MPHITINNTNYHYKLTGEGSVPLILIAGYTGNYLFYEAVLPALKPYYKILTFDNRGIGQTTDDNTELSAELMADDIMVLAEQLNLVKPHIVGQSMGGTIAQAIASRHVDKINKLALLTTSAKWRTAMLSALHSLLMLRKNDIDFELQISATLPWIFGEKFLSSPKNIAAFKAAILADAYPQSLENQQRQFKVLEKFDGREQLKAITAETLIVYGDEDLIALPQEAEFLAANIAKATLKKVACAHGITVEAPQTLADLLLEFF